MPSHEQRPCRHCHGNVHAFVCNCSHDHSSHIHGGPCKIFACECTGYDQTRGRLLGETDQQCEKRLLLMNRRKAKVAKVA